MVKVDAQNCWSKLMLRSTLMLISLVKVDAQNDWSKLIFTSTAQRCGVCLFSWLKGGRWRGVGVCINSLQCMRTWCCIAFSILCVKHRKTFTSADVTAETPRLSKQSNTEMCAASKTETMCSVAKGQWAKCRFHLLKPCVCVDMGHGTGAHCRLFTA